MSSCIFCRIASGEIPSKSVHETPNTFAFRDINGQAPIHVLVIPKAHVARFAELGACADEITSAICAVAEKEAIVESGYRVVLNQGADAGQEVEHLHFHVLGGRKLRWPPG